MSGFAQGHIFLLFAYLLWRGHVIKLICKKSSRYAYMFVKVEYAKFKSKIFDETKFIQYLELMRWHFCQVYVHTKAHVCSSRREQYFIKFHICHNYMVVPTLIVDPGPFKMK